MNKDNIDKECHSCRRFYSGSCKGVEDRKRKEINILNSCSGYLDIQQPKERYM